MSRIRYYEERRRSPTRWWQFAIGGLLGALAVAMIPPAPAVQRSVAMACWDTRPASDGYRLASTTKKAPAFVCDGVTR